MRITLFEFIIGTTVDESVLMINVNFSQMLSYIPKYRIRYLYEKVKQISYLIKKN